MKFYKCQNCSIVESEKTARCQCKDCSGAMLLFKCSIGFKNSDYYLKDGKLYLKNNKNDLQNL